MSCRRVIIVASATSDRRRVADREAQAHLSERAEHARHKYTAIKINEHISQRCQNKTRILTPSLYRTYTFVVSCIMKIIFSFKCPFVKSLNYFIVVIKLDVSFQLLCQFHERLETINNFRNELGISELIIYKLRIQNR